MVLNRGVVIKATNCSDHPIKVALVIDITKKAPRLIAYVNPTIEPNGEVIDWEEKMAITFKQLRKAMRKLGMLF